MTSPESAAGTVPVERAELVTQDMDLIAELIGRLYVEHGARFSCADPSRVDGSVRSAAAGGLSASQMRYCGFGYDAEVDLHTDPHAVVVLQGDGVISTARVPGRALRHAFRRHYGTTPAGYLRQARLECAHQELAAAEPGGGVTVAAVARKWGWASPSQFAAAYQRRYGQPPSHTLRT